MPRSVRGPAGRARAAHLLRADLALLQGINLIGVYCRPVVSDMTINQKLRAIYVAIFLL
jgi:hypothetical protein